MDWISRGLVPVALMMTGDDDGEYDDGCDSFCVNNGTSCFCFCPSSDLSCYCVVVSCSECTLNKTFIKDL